MTKSAIAVVLMILMGVPFAHAATATGTFAEAKAMAARDNKPLLVDFYAEW